MTAFAVQQKDSGPPQTILHLDLDAFFCAVEELRHPALRGTAFAVGGRPGERGVVCSCSYAARKFGIRSGMPMAQAGRLQREIRDDIGLPSSIGIASNKLVAKIATEVGKKSGRGDRPPFGLTLVPRGEERSFLAPLPMEMLWGVGPKTGRKLASIGIRTIGDIAGWPEASLVAAFGEYGRELCRRARG